MNRAAEITIALPDAAATERLGAVLWRALPDVPLVVELAGDLGAGKTTLVRGLIRAAGHQGPVRSPTYTLIEPYEFDSHRVLHLDLYRLGSAEELEDIGLRDELHGRYVLLAEWPERGAGVLPEADLKVALADGAPDGRTAHLTAVTAAGRTVVTALTDAWSDRGTRTGAGV